MKCLLNHKEKSILYFGDERKTKQEFFELVDKGEIRYMKRVLDKRAITFGQVDNLIILLSKKYKVSSDVDSDNSGKDIDVNISPVIVIKETFLQ
jgi:hypothetical protein